MGIQGGSTHAIRKKKRVFVLVCFVFSVFIVLFFVSFCFVLSCLFRFLVLFCLFRFVLFVCFFDPTRFLFCFVFCFLFFVFVFVFTYIYLFILRNISHRHGENRMFLGFLWSKTNFCHFFSVFTVLKYRTPK